MKYLISLTFFFISRSPSYQKSPLPNNAKGHSLTYFAVVGLSVITQQRNSLCCAVLCCAVLCCAVLCCGNSNSSIHSYQVLSAKFHNFNNIIISPLCSFVNFASMFFVVLSKFTISNNYHISMLSSAPIHICIVPSR